MATMTDEPHADGGCTCRRVRYRMHGKPLFTNCCHCRWCQRESGSAFVINALVEASRFDVLAGKPEIVHTPSASGRGQQIARCPGCMLALWSVYSAPNMRFVRVGTLDNPNLCPPDVHIFTESKQEWLRLPPGALSFPEYYDPSRYWPPESLARRVAALR